MIFDVVIRSYDIKNKCDKTETFKNVIVHTDINNNHLDLIKPGEEAAFLVLQDIKIEFESKKIFICGYELTCPYRSEFARISVYLFNDDKEKNEFSRRFCK